MVRETIQYQQIAEPLFVEAPAIVPSMDSWFVEAPQPYPSVLVHQQPTQSVNFAVPIFRHPWNVFYPDRVDDIPRLEYLDEWFFWHPDTPVAVAVPSMDSWFRLTEEPYPAIPVHQQPDSLVWHPSTVVIVPSMSSWFQQEPEFVRDIERFQHLYPWLFWHTDTPVAVPSMDSWFIEAQQPFPAILIHAQPDSLVLHPRPVIVATLGILDIGGAVGLRLDNFKVVRIIK